MDASRPITTLAVLVRYAATMQQHLEAAEDPEWIQDQQHPHTYVRNPPPFRHAVAWRNQSAAAAR